MSGCSGRERGEARARCEQMMADRPSPTRRGSPFRTHTHTHAYTHTHTHIQTHTRKLTSVCLTPLLSLVVTHTHTHPYTSHTCRRPFASSFLSPPLSQAEAAEGSKGSGGMKDRQEFMSSFWQLTSLKRETRVEAAARILAILAAWSVAYPHTPTWMPTHIDAAKHTHTRTHSHTHTYGYLGLSLSPSLAIMHTRA